MLYMQLAAAFVCRKKGIRTILIKEPEGPIRCDVKTSWYVFVLSSSVSPCLDSCGHWLQLIHTETKGLTIGRMGKHWEWSNAVENHIYMRNNAKMYSTGDTIYRFVAWGAVALYVLTCFKVIDCQSVLYCMPLECTSCCRDSRRISLLPCVCGDASMVCG